MHYNNQHGYRPTVACGRPAPYAREALVISLLYWGPVRPVRCFYGPLHHSVHTLSPSSFTPKSITVILSTTTYRSLRLPASNRFRIRTFWPVQLSKFLNPV